MSIQIENNIVQLSSICKIRQTIQKILWIYDHGIINPKYDWITSYGLLIKQLSQEQIDSRKCNPKCVFLRRLQYRIFTAAHLIDEALNHDIPIVENISASKVIFQSAFRDIDTLILGIESEDIPLGQQE